MHYHLFIDCGVFKSSMKKEVCIKINLTPLPSKMNGFLLTVINYIPIAKKCVHLCPVKVVMESNNIKM